RGFRIELGEIEYQLLSHDEVNDAVVVALSSGKGDKRLVAYVTHDEATAMLTEENNDAAQTLRHDFIDSLKATLTQALPDYMVPSAFVVLDKLPLTPNGKVDRKGLPTPDMSLQQKSYVAPTTATEKLLCEIWQDVLGIEQVGITDNFFALGGHSLLIISVVSEISKTLEVHLTLKSVFSTPTVAESAVFIDAIKLNERYEASMITAEFEEGEF
ncbi:phosphopantetheine-binding protein, partial [Thalassotalea sp. ND16A]|uniref:phosphopantetheine-binding protein n=1 Tax=Thalassotalea sp. ND16A TaxID=1535422 RepID=UPI00051DA5AA